MTARDINPIRFVPARPGMGAYANSMPHAPEIGDADPKLPSVPGSVDFGTLSDVAPIQQAAATQTSDPLLDDLMRRQDEELAMRESAPAQTVDMTTDSTPSVEDLRPKRTPAQIASAKRLAEGSKKRAAAKATEQTEPESPAPAATTPEPDLEDEELF